MANVTQDDVARLAGVSRATVSYVLNNRSDGGARISEETRQRVLDAIAKLGYLPDAAARTLRTGRTRLLAVMVPDLTNPFYPLLIRGAQQLAAERSYELLVYDTNDQAARELAFVDTVLRRRVDGVILVAFHLVAEDVARLLRANVQVVAVGGRLRGAGVDTVATHERLAVVEMLNHLLARGHQRIAHIAGPQNTPPGRVRMQGYREALEAAGITYDEALVRYARFGREGVAELVEELLPAAPTAVFAANDVMAIAAIRALMRAGKHVPEDVAVCGFDNIPEAEMVLPALTTVGQDMQALGELAATMLLERVESQEEIAARHVRVPYQVIVRESS